MDPNKDKEYVSENLNDQYDEEEFIISDSGSDYEPNVETDDEDTRVLGAERGEIDSETGLPLTAEGVRLRNAPLAEQLRRKGHDLSSFFESSPLEVEYMKRTYIHKDEEDIVDNLGTLSRNDSRPKEDIFENGFVARAPESNASLHYHGGTSGDLSPYISTGTSQYNVTSAFGHDNTYEIDPKEILKQDIGMYYAEHPTFVNSQEDYFENYDNGNTREENPPGGEGLDISEVAVRGYIPSEAIIGVEETKKPNHSYYYNERSEGSEKTRWRANANYDHYNHLDGTPESWWFKGKLNDEEIEEYE